MASSIRCRAVVPGLAKPAVSVRANKSAGRSATFIVSAHLCRQDRVACASTRELVSVDRRAVLAGFSLLPSLLPGPALADEPDFTLFQGTASPPTSYGGYGGNAEESFKYQFLVPSDWKPQVINKVEKGTQGIDCKFLNPSVRGMKVFVISLGRAGEDAKQFKINDVEATFQGFAGADYAIQDALTTADEITTTQREADGDTYFEYIIDSPITHYTASIATKRGKIFAMFIAVPARAYPEQKPVVEKMLGSFTTL